ncbi:uncharacterized protein sS8_3585 [Methylocaldum marinum]|uniref:Uncharacterized protein n=1 Tax=Methylocaldum marinum TaxID=1432792 RepID=A0A250KVA9_9GAMM|nr:hypothetical protein [Methylocaldum marinum]BBA35522.1 uncharacterized protein sS8_3585 [Methylocaldum marinum]
MNIDLRQQILSDITKSYHNLSFPNFSFILERHKAGYYSDLIAKLKATFSLTDNSDFNYHQCYSFSLKAGSQEWGLELSLVGRYGFCQRHGHDNIVLTEKTPKNKIEHGLIDTLCNQNVILLSMEDLKTDLGIFLVDEDMSLGHSGFVFNLLFWRERYIDDL